MNKQPAFSIVLAIHDQADETEQNLPLLLSQQYDGDYQVIAVDECSTDGTADVLERLKAEHDRLYTTFVPKYQFQRNRLRLALTIGVKAARHEWVVFFDVSKEPPSQDWLQELSGFCTPPTLLLLGYINKKSGNVSLNTFTDIAQAGNLVRRAERWRAGVGHDRWMRHLRRSTNYDFIAVRADNAHELLRLYSFPPKL